MEEINKDSEDIYEESSGNFQVTPRTKSEIVRAFLKNTVSEPFFFLLMFGYMSRTTTYQEVIQYKACIYNFGYNETICSDLENDNFVIEEDQVQRLTGNISMGQTIISIVPSIFSLVFLVSFSAKFGRKIPTLIACLGLLLDTVGAIMFMIDLRGSSALLLLLPSIPNGVSGGLVVAVTMAMAYLSETAESGLRPLRFTIVEVAFLTSVPAGGAFGGYIRSTYGFIPVFASAAIVNVIAMIWIFFRMNDPTKEKLTSCKDTLREFVNLESVKENIRITVMKRKGNIRKKIWLLVFSASIYLIVSIGTINIGFLYAQREYKWTNFKYSVVSALTSVLQGFGLLTVVPLLTKVFKAHECVLIIVGDLSNAAKFLLWTFAFKENLYYLGCICGSVSGIANVAVKSYLSRLVDVKEIGNIFSVLSLCEGLTPIIGTALWTQVYNAALPQFPGLAYMCSAILLIIPIILSIWMLKDGEDYTRFQDENEEKQLSNVAATNELTLY